MPSALNPPLRAKDGGKERSDARDHVTCGASSRVDWFGVLNRDNSAHH